MTTATMAKFMRAAALAAAACLSSHALAGEQAPEWAFPVNPPGTPAPVDDGKVRTLPGSKAQFTFADLRNFFSPPDWYPEDHPAMPPLVAHGAKPNAFACGFCHLPTGNGRPENANIAGLPADYIVQQVKDMKSGVRKSSLPERYPQSLMWKLAEQAADEQGLAEAAQYFAGMKATRVTKVVEANIIPKVEITHWIYKKSDAGGTEPIGNRLVEVPDDFERFEKRDGHVTYTAYVPEGSLAAGEKLVRTGGDGKTTACTQCHGLELRGAGSIPPLAGRSPTYLARQLHDIKSGARHGEMADLMKPVVEHLTNEDLIYITAYLASLEP